MRALSRGMISIPLPEVLPDRFTLETSVNLDHGNAHLWILPGDETLDRAGGYSGSVVAAEWAQTGIRARTQGPDALTRHDHSVWDEVVPLRVMADGDYIKVYLGESRMANVPNAVFPRTDRLFVDVSSATQDRPILMGPVRIASGGADLYDRLAADGRVATQGILFDVDSDRIRPESTPTLKEIGTMLQEHPDLRISIEGHTDNDGDDAYNLDLSKRRAAAVRDFLITDYDIDPDRLESEGFGESMPTVPNDTPEGKQQNRRVELVRR
jgi:outer membrane protein OmpA-like peptidoglycan-associated protein